MADISSWSPVDGSNNASPPNGWPENMLPSAVNDCARAMMGAIRRNYDQTISGALSLPYLPIGGGVITGSLNIDDNFSVDGWIAVNGDINCGSQVTAPYLTASSAVTAPTINATEHVHAVLDVTADRDVYARHVNLSGNVGAAGNLSGTDVYATHNAYVTADVTASGYFCDSLLVINTGSISTPGGPATVPFFCNESGGAAIQAHSASSRYLSDSHAFQNAAGSASAPVSASAFNATGNITAGAGMTVAGSIFAGGQVGAALVTSTGDISATGNIHGIGYFCDGMAALDVLNVSTPTGPHPAPSLLNDFAAPAIQVHSQNNLYTSTVHIFVDSGGAYAPLQASAFVVSSDRRLKTDIEPASLGLPEVLRLNPVSFRRLHAQQGREVGFIAQDVQEALPQAVTSLELNGETTLAVNDMPILAALVNAIKDIAKRLDRLEDR